MNSLRAVRGDSPYAIRERAAREQLVFDGKIWYITSMKHHLVAALLLLFLLGLAGCARVAPEAAAEELHAQPTQPPEAPVVIQLSTPEPVAEQPVDTPAPTSVPQPANISLRFVGDLMCCNYQIAGALKADGSYDFAPSLASIRPHLQGADVLFGNLETNVYDGRPINGEKKFFNAPPEFLDAVRDCGFNVLFTANNHALDVGVAGQLSTLEQVRARGMDTVGTSMTAEEESQIYLREVRGVQLAVLSYTRFTNKDEADDFQLDGVDTPWILNLYAPERMAADVEQARALGADVVIMYLHDGKEKSNEPNKRQLAAADEAFAAGVDVLIMSHTHSLLPMEKRTVTVDGVEKTVFCAFGLGNFLSSALPEEALNNIILDLGLTYDFAAQRVTAIDARYLLTYTYKYYDADKVRQFVVVGMEDAFADPACVPPLVTTNPARVQKAYETMLARIGREAAVPVRSF